MAPSIVFPGDFIVVLTELLPGGMDALPNTESLYYQVASSTKHLLPPCAFTLSWTDRAISAYDRGFDLSKKPIG